MSPPLARNPRTRPNRAESRNAAAFFVPHLPINMRNFHRKSGGGGVHATPGKVWKRDSEYQPTILGMRLGIPTDACGIFFPLHPGMNIERAACPSRFSSIASSRMAPCNALLRQLFAFFPN